MRCIALGLLFAAFVPSCDAKASEIAGSPSTVTYTAAPGEQNKVLVSVTPYESMCGAVGTPCLKVWDSGAHISAVSGTCQLVSADPIVGDTAQCTLPGSVVANLGDRDDAFWDWDGPSTIDAGPGNDTPIYGAGGNDVLRGGIGTDTLYGQDGDDVLDGGPGDDYLEGVPCGYCEEEAITHGSDTYVGGGGGDTLTYEGRSENLALSVDGVANDGAPGEHDNIGADIGAVYGGRGSDTLTGNAGRNAFFGGAGDDALVGAGSDDHLAGGSGSDRIDGGPGQDVLGGDDGDDVLVGGEGVDRFWGDDVGACIAYSCASGQDLIEARDGEREQINCGPGTDAAVVDPVDIVVDWVDLSDRCESADGAAAGGAAPAAGGPALQIASVAVDRRHRIVVRLTAPAAGTVRVKATAGRIKVVSTSRKVRAGKLTLRLTPSRAARRALARRHRLKVALRITFNGAGEQTRTVTLRR